MAELNSYLILIPCGILGFVVGWRTLPRVGTLWATLPFAVFVSFAATTVWLRYAVTKYFGDCGTGVDEFVVATFLTLGTLGVLTTQATAALGQTIRRVARGG